MLYRNKMAFLKFGYYVLRFFDIENNVRRSGFYCLKTVVFFFLFYSVILYHILAMLFFVKELHWVYLYIFVCWSKLIVLFFPAAHLFRPWQLKAQVSSSYFQEKRIVRSLMITLISFRCLNPHLNLNKSAASMCWAFCPFDTWYSDGWLTSFSSEALYVKKILVKVLETHTS